MSSWMTQTGQIAKHRDGTTSFACQTQGVTDKIIGKATAIRRVGDYVTCARPILVEKVYSASSITAMSQIGRNDIITGVFEYVRNGSVAASRFPNIAIEAFD